MKIEGFYIWMYFILMNLIGKGEKIIQLLDQMELCGFEVSCFSLIN